MGRERNEDFATTGSELAAVVEARAFFRIAPNVGFDRLTPALIEAFAARSVSLQPRLLSEAELIFALAGLRLCVALEEAPDRPGGFAAASVFRVTGARSGLGPGARLGVCYIALTALLALDNPAMIHWGPNGRDFDTAEFREAAGLVRRAPMHPHLRLVVG